MRYSKMLIPTTKEAPSDATLPSHIYLLRGGFIESVGGSGLYNFLPLGKRVLDRVKQVVKEELDKAGAQEVSLSFVTPASMWEKSGRFQKYGKELLRFKDRKDADFVLGPTHEEMMVSLVKNHCKSYKQLPLNLYQINLKFRDEVRPRFGLMRGREFLMKDGYSFHASHEDMVREFELMEQTYRRIFERLGLEFRAVEADSGAIGGSASKEFMVLAQSGEDTIVVCQECDYGANIEAAEASISPYHFEPIAQNGKIHTPGISSIEALSEHLGIKKAQALKLVAKRALYDDDSKIVLFGVGGDRELQEIKATNAVGANELVDVEAAELEEIGLVPGFMGLDGLDETIELVVDSALKGATNMVMGANEKEYHLSNINLDNYELKYASIAAVNEGDCCRGCGGKLSYTKGIEVGHIFQLGTRYSEPMECQFLDENGKLQPMIMGTYGIGVSRLLAAIIEQHHDESGCIWTKQSAPFDLYIMISNIKDEEQVAYATALYEELTAKGYEVLLDDRKERFGAKIKDFELLGIPYGVVVGKKLSQEQSVELIERQGLKKSLVKSDAIIPALQEVGL